MPPGTKKKRMSQEERSRLSTERLIDACVELASEVGASAITFDLVGERAGYSRNLAFQKFGSKTALIEAVINHLHDVVDAAHAAVDLDGYTGLEAVQGFCETHFVAFKRGSALRAYTVLQAAAVSELSDSLSLFEEANKRTGRKIKQLLKRGVADKSVRSDINLDQATMIIGTQLHGISSESIVEKDMDLGKALLELRSMISRAYGRYPKDA